MTPFSTVYDSFLAKILEDEWGEWTEEEVQEDMYQILLGAIPYFKFPRTSLVLTDEGFEEDLSNEEIQILSTYMKCEWLNRSIMTWENVKPLYEERDFSQANLLNQLRQKLEQEQTKALNLESIYYRSVDKKPFKYRKLAGDTYVP